MTESPTPDLVDLYVRASAAFGGQVIAIGDDQWASPTPCVDWDVRALVAHVVLGDAVLPDMIAGAKVDPDQSSDVTILGPEPVSSWRGTALRAIESVRGADLGARVDHPLGKLSLARVLGFRITDNLVHAWDLSVTLGDELILDDDIAEWCIDFWAPMADGLADSSYFDPIRQPVDETPSARLLGLLGRSG